MTVAAIIEDLLGGELLVRFEAYDGSVTGDPDAPATIHIRSEDALNHILFGGIGPEFVPFTGPIEPYAFATAGLTGFVTSSSLNDYDGTGQRTVDG